jgi:hypothetical protein
MGYVSEMTGSTGIDASPVSELVNDSVKYGLERDYTEFFLQYPGNAKFFLCS